MYQIAQLRAHTSRLPKAQLGFFPTPVYRLNRLSDTLGIELYIKRDDFTGMNLFVGNKIGARFFRSNRPPRRISFTRFPK